MVGGIKRKVRYTLLTRYLIEQVRTFTNRTR